MKRLVESPASVDRRFFLKVGVAAGGGLLISTYVPFGEALASTLPATAESFTPNAFITIAPTGAITIIAPNSEMGQGIKTGLPMIVAEELDVPWQQVTVVQGDLNPAYGRQFSVGSQSTPTNYVPVRPAARCSSRRLRRRGASRQLNARRTAAPFFTRRRSDARRMASSHRKRPLSQRQPIRRSRIRKTSSSLAPACPASTTRRS